MSAHKPRRFSAEGDFIDRLEGSQRHRLIPKEDIVAFLDLSSKDLLLDLGAGIGYFSIPASKQAGNVLALDIEPKMLEVFAKRISENRLKNIDLARGDISAIPVKDASVDHVLAAFVYHEMPSPRKFIKGCFRVLSKGGRLTIVDFQKRETPIGPPLEERKTPSEVLSATSSEFDLESRHETDVYYALRFRRR